MVLSERARKSSVEPKIPRCKNGTWGTRRVIPQNNHGHIVYLTEQEENNKQDLQYISIGLFLATMVATYFHKKESSRA